MHCGFMRVRNPVERLINRNARPSTPMPLLKKILMKFET